MMSDCYGIPFMCNLQKKGDNSNQDNNSPFMVASFAGTGTSETTNGGIGNSIKTHQNDPNYGSMSAHANYNNGQTILSSASQNGEVDRNPFFQTQQNMVSGIIASGMNNYGQPLNTGGTGMLMGEENTGGNNMASYMTGLTSGSVHHPKFGPGGTVEQATKAKDSNGTVICKANWVQCQQTCISIDPNTLCPVCTCDKTTDGHNKQPNITKHGQNTRPDPENDPAGCQPFPPNCPSHCVEFDDSGCTICTCENNELFWYEDIWN
ncbi:uncharacterized protein [Argopecten irradians]